VTVAARPLVEHRAQAVRDLFLRGEVGPGGGELGQIGARQRVADRGHRLLGRGDLVTGMVGRIL